MKGYLNFIFVLHLALSVNISCYTQHNYPQFIPYRTANGWTVSNLAGDKMTSQIFDSVVHFPKTKYILIQKKDKWGLLDSNMHETIPCEYDYPPWFCGYGILVVKDKKMGVLDETGEIIVPIIYDVVFAGIPYDSQPATYIEKKLRNMVPEQKKEDPTKTVPASMAYVQHWPESRPEKFFGFYDYEFPFINYQAEPHVNYEKVFTTLKREADSFNLGLYSFKGEKLLRDKYKSIQSFYSTSTVLTYDGSTVVIHKFKDGELFAYDSVTRVYLNEKYEPFGAYRFKNYFNSENFIWIKKGDYYQTICLSRKIPSNYYNNFDFSNLLMIPTTHYELNDNFHYFGDKSGGYIVNAYGKRISRYFQESVEPNRFHQNGKYLIYGKSVIDTNGNVVYNGYYQQKVNYTMIHSEIFEIHHSEDSTSFISVNDDLYRDSNYIWLFRMNRKYPLKYFTGNFLFVKNNKEKWGVFDLKGNEVLPVRYDQIECPKYSHDTVLFSVSKDKKWGLMDEFGKEVLPVKFDENCFAKWQTDRNGEPNGYFYSVCDKNGVSGMVDEKGRKKFWVKNQMYFHYMGDMILVVYSGVNEKVVKASIFDMETEKLIFETVDYVEYPVDVDDYSWWSLEDDDFSDGYLTVYADGKWSIIDRKGQKLGNWDFETPVMYYPDRFLINVLDGPDALYLNGRISEYIIDDVLKMEKDTSKFQALVRVNADSAGRLANKYFLIDKKMQKNEIKIGELTIAHPNERIHLFRQNGKYGICDSLYNILEPAQWGHIGKVHQNYILFGDTCFYLFHGSLKEKSPKPYYYFNNSQYYLEGWNTIMLNSQPIIYRNNVNLQNSTRRFENVSLPPKFDLFNAKGKLIAEDILPMFQMTENLYLAKKDGKIVYYDLNNGFRYSD